MPEQEIRIACLNLKRKFKWKPVMMGAMGRATQGKGSREETQGGQSSELKGQRAVEKNQCIEAREGWHLGKRDQEDN